MCWDNNKTNSSLTRILGVTEWASCVVLKYSLNSMVEVIFCCKQGKHRRDDGDGDAECRHTSSRLQRRGAYTGKLSPWMRRICSQSWAWR